jgi:hypothetical protein
LGWILLPQGARVKEIEKKRSSAIRFVVAFVNRAAHTRGVSFVAMGKAFAATVCIRRNPNWGRLAQPAHEAKLRRFDSVTKLVQAQ